MDVTTRELTLLARRQLGGGKTALEAIDWPHENLGSPRTSHYRTGDTAPARIREAHDSGFLLLHKPVEPERLRVRINSLAESVPAEKENKPPRSTTKSRHPEAKVGA